MAQIDQLTYFPALLWFMVMFSIIYSNMYGTMLPSVYAALKVRRLFLYYLLNSISAVDIFLVLLRNASTIVYRSVMPVSISVFFFEFVIEKIFFVKCMS